MWVAVGDDLVITVGACLGLGWWTQIQIVCRMHIAGAQMRMGKSHPGMKEFLMGCVPDRTERWRGTP
jgi:hypothetical protein